MTESSFGQRQCGLKKNKISVSTEQVLCIKKYKTNKKISALTSSDTCLFKPLPLGDDKCKNKGTMWTHYKLLCLFTVPLLPGRWWTWGRRGRGSERVWRLSHEAHEWGLWWSKLLSHQRLRPSCGWRRSLAKLILGLAGLILTSSTNATTRLASGTGVVAPAAAVALVLIGARVVAVPVIAAPVPVGGRGAVSIAVVPAVTVEAAAAVFAATAGAHAPITLLLIHQVRVVGAATTVTHSASASASTA